ncbi:restriction endonuclease subunit S [Methanosarcina sp. Mfa9]|uniref:restriction endonuclease subunit S n=1 Tax=Methanosarcina sp. Mfa9 TaxID=3439063 RepID=UPI003F875712
MKKLPDEWTSLKFGELFSFEKKSKFKASEGKNKGTYKFFNSSNVQSKYIDSFTFDGEFLVFGTGGNASVHYVNDKFSTSTDCLVAKKTDNQILLKYVNYYLITNMHLLEAGFKGAGLKHISKNYIQNIVVPFPRNLKTQQKIVSILEKAEKLKEWRKEADELADEFLKSTFLEMFGSPGKNEMEWNLIPLEKVCSEIYRYPTFYGIDYIEKGTPIVRISNILPDGPLDPDVSNYVFFDSKINNKFPRTILEFNDIVMAVRGDGSTAKRIGLVNTFNLVGANISPNLLRIKADGFNLNPIYLFHFMTSYGGQLLLQKSVTRTAKKNITAGNVKKISIPIPPMLLQKKFATLVEDTKKMQVNQKQSQNNIDSLFNALMQKAFRGELVC